MSEPLISFLSLFVYFFLNVRKNQYGSLVLEWTINYTTSRVGPYLCTLSCHFLRLPSLFFTSILFVFFGHFLTKHRAVFKVGYSSLPQSILTLDLYTKVLAKLIFLQKIVLQHFQRTSQMAFYLGLCSQTKQICKIESNSNVLNKFTQNIL